MHARSWLLSILVSGFTLTGTVGCGLQNPASAFQPTQSGKVQNHSFEWQLTTTPLSPQAGKPVTVRIALLNSRIKIPPGTMSAVFTAYPANAPDKAFSKPVALQSKTQGVYTGTLTAPSHSGTYQLQIVWKQPQQTVHHAFRIAVQ